MGDAMSRLIKTIGFLIIGITILFACLGAYMLLTKNMAGVSAAADNTNTDIKMAATRGFLYASHPLCIVNDSVLITAHVYQNGQPIKKAGIPVDFTLSDERFARLDKSVVYTDQWGTASTYIRSYASGELIPTHPYLVNVTAAALGNKGMLTIKMTRFITQDGTVTDKKGDPVEGAVVTLVYGGTNDPINAIGSTTVTDANGNYRLAMVPTDVGDVNIYVKKGSLQTHMPANFSSLQDLKF